MQMLHLQTVLSQVKPRLVCNNLHTKFLWAEIRYRQQWYLRDWILAKKVNNFCSHSVPQCTIMLKEFNKKC